MKQISIMVFALIALSSLALAQSPQQNWSATIQVDTVLAAPGTEVGVPIRLLDNTADISALQIPLWIEPNPDIKVDSVQVNDSFITNDFYWAVLPATDIEDTLQISILPYFSGGSLPALSSPNGVIATIWFTVGGAVDPGLNEIDSIALDTVISGIGPDFRWVNASDPLGQSLFPDVVKGGVNVDMTLDINDGDDSPLPGEFSLAQNYPNPFNPMTTIEFSLPHAGQIELVVFNILGQEVQTLVDRRLSAGVHRIEFDAGDKPSGIYFYRLVHAEGVETRKMTLIK